MTAQKWVRNTRRTAVLGLGELPGGPGIIALTGFLPALRSTLIIPRVSPDSPEC